MNSVLNVGVKFGSNNGLSYVWGIGSILGCWMVTQVVSGIELAMTFDGSFQSSCEILDEMEGGMSVRYLHANVCSLLFFLLWLHLGKAWWFGDEWKDGVWKSSVILFLMSMSSAFLSYVIVWSNISFWSATVILNIITVLPYGPSILEELYGGFACSERTATRLLALHIILPLVILGLVIIHIMILHEYVSSDAGLGLVNEWGFEGVLWNDMVGLGWTTMLMMMVFIVPCYFMESENWWFLDAMATPAHIKPEWYFLFAYALLRCVSNNVISLLFFILSVVIVIAVVWYSIPVGYVGGVFVSTWLSGLVVMNHYNVMAQIWVSIIIL